MLYALFSLLKCTLIFTSVQLKLGQLLRSLVCSTCNPTHGELSYWSHCLI